MKIEFFNSIGMKNRLFKFRDKNKFLVKFRGKIVFTKKEKKKKRGICSKA